MRKYLFAIIAVALVVQASAATSLAWDHWPGEWSPNRPSLFEAEAEARQSIQKPVFRLVVPFRTQKDGGAWQVSNCGPAALGMVLDAFGISGQATDDLRFRSHTYQDTVGRRTGTALDHIARVADDFGLRSTGLYSLDGGYNSWSLEDIRGQLRLGHPVMPLVRLYHMPGYESIGTRWGHYVLLTGLTPGGFFYSDPLQTDAASGTTGWVSDEQLALAMSTSHIPGQAVAFTAPDRAPLRIWTP